MNNKYEKKLDDLNKEISKNLIDTSPPKLIIVTKSQKTNQIREIADCGYKYFGENYVDEAIKKIDDLNNKNLEWHFIGKIQSNKIKKICQNFHWIQTVCSQKHISLIDNNCRKIKKSMNVCIQINIDNEKTKSGIFLDELDDFLLEMPILTNILIRGLMAIPSKSNVLKGELNSYKILKLTFDKYKEKYNKFDTLSIGMSNDFKIAIKNGSNMIRIGQYIFGERVKQ